jgi:uncharacterized protein (TIGR03000 family)
MSRFKYPILLALALAAFAWTASPTLAQRGRGGWGGGRGWGGGWGGGGWYGGRGGYGGYGGYGWGGGYYPRYGWGYGGSYPSYGYSGYYPGYAYDYGTPTYVYPDTPTVITRQSGSYAPPTDNTAMVHVRVPSNATVWFDGDRTQQSGTDRTFASPPLKPGNTYSYEVRARWMDNGKPVEETRTVKVRANETSNVDFMSEARPTNDVVRGSE